MPIVGKNDQSGAGAFLAVTPGTTLFTVTTSHVYTVTKLLITNTDTVNAVTVSVFHIPSGATFSGDDFVLLKAFSVGPSNGVGGAEDIRELAGAIFEAGDKLVVFAGTGSKLKFDVSYVDNG